MTPRASFVIPAYNADRWLSQTIYSCRNQTEKKIEIVIVNDGSTDATREIAEWHAKEDKRIVVYNCTNQGRSAARNFGNDKAESDLILVLDADDLATRNRVKDTIAVFELKKPDLMYGSFHMIDSFGTTDALVTCRAFDPEEAKKTKMNFICHSTMAYTKKLAQDIRYEEGVYTKLGLDDWKFQWEAYKKGYKIQHVKNALCYYRVTESGTMATRDPKAVAEAKEAYFAQA
jgi:cellulose synthase/poly-beta-1,6-N-acetylglucosamine synthase-like glycosyltransferase